MSTSKKLRRINVGDMRRCLAYNLNRIRRDRGYTQAELGYCVLRSQQQISSIEKALVSIDATLLLALQRVLECGTNDLYAPVSEGELSDYFGMIARSDGGLVAPSINVPDDVLERKARLAWERMKPVVRSRRTIADSYKGKDKYRARERDGQLSLLSGGDRAND